MNILLLSWRGPGHPNAGGAEISTHEHAKGWVKAGYNVTLFTSFYKGGKTEERIDGVRIIRSGNQFFGVRWKAFNWYLFARHERFDLVVDQFHGIPFFTPIYVRAKKLGFIHEVTKEIWGLNELPFPINFFVANLGSMLEPLIFKLYKGITFMTVSESTKNDLVAWGIPGQNIAIIHNGVTVLKTKQKKEQKKTLVFLGTLAKDKGIEDALRIFSIINKKFNNWQFWVVGKSSPLYLDELKKQSENLNISNIRFWGFVSEEKKIELLSKAHIIVNPSIREGWGLVVIEAASLGIPTAAFNVPGLKDSIMNKKTGIINYDHTVESLANEIMNLLEDKERYNIICCNAIIWSKNFSWEKSTKMSLNLIKRVTG